MSDGTAVMKNATRDERARNQQRRLPEQSRRNNCPPLKRLTAWSDGTIRRRDEVIVGDSVAPREESQVLRTVSADNLDAGPPGKISDDLLELLSEKCEKAKDDLENNWTYQILSLGIGLGLIYGLGDPLSRKLFETPGYERLLYLIMPIANLYFYMRFGLLATHFSRIRSALEEAARQYCRDKEFDDDLIVAISESNSVIEYYHGKTFSFGVLFYSLFVLIVLSGNQSVSFFLLHKLASNIGGYQIVLLTIYAIPFFVPTSPIILLISKMRICILPLSACKSIIQMC
jgi:hypothetical protein